MKPYQIILIVLVILGLGIGGYYFMKKKNETKNNTTAPTFNPGLAVYKSKEPTQTDLTQTFTNDAHKVTIKYPSGWISEDLGGQKNVTEPLVRENIAYFFDSTSKVNEVGATAKMIRFMLENETKITKQSDWETYIKNKINSFVADTSLSEEIGYQLISIAKADNINGHFAMVENYTLKDNVRARDYYIFADDLYQFIFQANSESFDKYSSLFDQMAKSFEITK